jgi:hypothetical protein
MEGNLKERIEQAQVEGRVAARVDEFQIALVVVAVVVSALILLHYRRLLW